MRMKTLRQSGAVVAFVVILSVLLAACGGSDTNSSEASATPTPSASGLGSGIAALKAYLDEVKPIAADVGTTMDALPGAVKGLSKTPDDTWSTAADNLNEIALQLGQETGSLQSLTPPATLQPVQDKAVAALERAQGSVEKMADGLDSRAQTSATRRAKILAKVEDLQSQLSELKTQLTGGIESLMGQ